MARTIKFSKEDILEKSVEFIKEKGIKIAFLGSNKVGKTSIINSLKGKGINKKYEHTNIICLYWKFYS